MINVYIADLTGLEKEYDKKLNMLHKSRADKLASYKMLADRIRGLGAGLLLEKGLEDYFSNLRANTEAAEPDKENRCGNADILPKDEEGRYILHYGYGPQGKPYLKDYSDIHFSLSHSGHMAVLALSDVEVGIDVQENQGFREKVMKRFYHEREIQIIEAITNPAEREACFYQIWTGKEAYIKYTGRGMGQDLRSFCVDLPNERIVEDGQQTAWCKKISLETKDYFCTLVCDKIQQKIDKISRI